MLRLMVCLGIFGLACPSKLWSQERLAYFGVPTLPQHPAVVHRVLIDTGENHALGKDTLFQVVNAKGEPIAYYRKILQEACFNGQCRPLNLQLYWNITGRYLGFELPSGEFLSKTEHVPFTANEYHQLHKLLADSLSPLGNFNYLDLTPTAARKTEKLDGITAPTATSVLPYVVKGAVYTTYVLWKLVYGSTQQEVQRLTKQVLTAAMAHDMLESPDRSDHFWLLNNLDGLDSLTGALEQQLVGMVSDRDYTLGERVLRVLPNRSLNSDTIQLELLQQFQGSTYSLRLLILEKLMQANALYPSAVRVLTAQLKDLNGAALAVAFRLFRKFRIKNKETLTEIRKLQHSDNAYIASLASDYLDDRD
ncbi:hypothetical protein GCM10023231_03810 [Olivibacter ginsenosidimutans]|uniref:HEAT repeat domain-containing protein n=1 Tax=Olivibacter ginsenosidimutans TaxID=1176537 RepID=A0ABP9AG34_9SPHI